MGEKYFHRHFKIENLTRHLEFIGISALHRQFKKGQDTMCIYFIHEIWFHTLVVFGGLVPHFRNSLKPKYMQHPDMLYIILHTNSPLLNDYDNYFIKSHVWLIVDCDHILIFYSGFGPTCRVQNLCGSWDPRGKKRKKKPKYCLLQATNGLRR